MTYRATSLAVAAAAFVTLIPLPGAVSDAEAQQRPFCTRGYKSAFVAGRWVCQPIAAQRSSMCRPPNTQVWTAQGWRCLVVRR